MFALNYNSLPRNISQFSKPNALSHNHYKSFGKMQPNQIELRKKVFLKVKLSLFGDYEDSITTKSHTVFHRILSPAMNLRLITPDIIIQEK